MGKNKRTRSGSRPASKSSAPKSNLKPNHSKKDDKVNIVNTLKQVHNLAYKMHIYTTKVGRKDVSNNPTICINFEKTLEKYVISKEPTDKIIPALNNIIKKLQYPLFIYTNRTITDIKDWIEVNVARKVNIGIEIIKDNFWTKQKVLGITDKVIPYLIYIDNPDDLLETDLSKLTEKISKLGIWKE